MDLAAMYQSYCLGPHGLAWGLPARASVSLAHPNFGSDLPKPKGPCGPTMRKSLNILVLLILCTHAHPLLASGTTSGDRALDNRGAEGRAITAASRLTWTPFPLSHHYPSRLPGHRPGSVWGLPLPSPCLHSHLPVREPRPPHSSHSGRLLLTAQDRGQPGSSATSAGGRNWSEGAGLDPVAARTQ